MKPLGARLVVAAFLLCTFALVAPSNTLAAGAAPPVTINSCGPIIDKNQKQTIFGLSIPVATSNGIAIEFVNDSKQTATLVNFAVDSSGNHFVIRDVGKFTPGISIKHEYRNGQGQSFLLPAFIAPNVTCHVASVEFADGTVWRKGQAAVATTQQGETTPASSSAALTANPTRVSIDRVANSALFMVTSTERVAAFKETDNCAGIASVFVAATGDSSATYSVKPLAAGSCTAHVADEDGNTVSVPIVVQ